MGSWQGKSFESLIWPHQISKGLWTEAAKTAHYLVGGFNPSEKYEPIGMIITNIWENKSHVPVATSQLYIFSCCPSYIGDDFIIQGRGIPNKTNQYFVEWDFGILFPLPISKARASFAKVHFPCAPGPTETWKHHSMQCHVKAARIQSGTGPKRTPWSLNRENLGGKWRMSWDS